MSPGKSRDTLLSIRQHQRYGLVLSLLLVVGVGGWAFATEISGAVIGNGQIVVETNVKKVQHQYGGVVSELLVTEGSQVKAGDIVVKLSDTVTRANLAIVEGTLNELLVRQSRLEAERDGLDIIVEPTAMNDEMKRLMEGERQLFSFRRKARDGQISQLKQRIDQAREQIRGLEEQVDAKRQEREFITEELAGLRDLWRKKLVPITRVTALERDATRIVGESGQLTANIASTKGKIIETELQILQVDQDLRKESSNELRDIQVKVAEATERKVTALDQLNRSDLRAPQDGVVYQLSVHTRGEVVAAGEPAMLIVPSDESLAVETKIVPRDIDQLRLGQRARLRLSALNQRTTFELHAEVTRVGADAEFDRQTGRSFYTVRLSLPKTEIAKLNGVKLVPGMPVEAFITTEQRTVMSFLTKPMSDQIMRAFRER
jgi:HlyD family secretion protein